MLRELVTTAARHGGRSGVPTLIPRLTIWSSDAPAGPVPILFEPKFYLLLQGAKRLTVGSKAFDFTAPTCAVAAVGLPLTCQVTGASRHAPYLGVELKLDPGIVANLLLDMSDNAKQSSESLSVMHPDDTVLEPLSRLLRLLEEPSAIAVLAPQLERELCYRLANGPLGGTLRQLCQRSGRFDQIRRAVEWICGNADQPLCIKRLAASVGMSVTSFHRHFKAVTAHSPLAYQRQIRLLDARRQLATGAANVTTTALATGYASPSQFSREYKRMFGVSPVRDTMLPRHSGKAI